MSNGVDQDAPSAANTVGNGTTRTTSDDLYAALGRIGAGIQLRQSEARQDRAALLEHQQLLLKQRREAEANNATGAFDSLTAKLDELDRRLRLLNHDLGEDDGSLRQPEHQDGERDGDERSGDGDAGIPGPDRSLAGQGADSDADGRGGDADGDEWRSDAARPA